MQIDWTQAEQQVFNRTLIEQTRLSVGMTRKALAQAVGVAPQTIANIEGAGRKPSGEQYGCKTPTLSKISEVLGIPRPALDPTPTRDDPSGVFLDPPRTINFRASSYPGDGQFDEPWAQSPLMLIVCPLSFRATLPEAGAITIERVMASLRLGEFEHVFELRTWADLVRGGPDLRKAQEALARTKPQSPRQRAGEARRDALAAVDRAWAAQAPSVLTGTSHFVPFQLTRDMPQFSMEACFRDTGSGWSWETFLDAVDPDEETPPRLQLSLAASVTTDLGEQSYSLQRTTLETRCLRRIKHWVEQRVSDNYLPRHIQPRVVEGMEAYCGREGHCCFDHGDMCCPVRA